MDGEVLVSIEPDVVHTLTGGAIQTGETSEAAAVREFEEETGLKVKAETLLGIIENFWSTNEGEKHQEVIFVYKLFLAEDSVDHYQLQLEEKFQSEWKRRDKINNLRPHVLNKIIRQTNGDQEKGIIHEVSYFKE